MYIIAPLICVLTRECALFIVGGARVVEIRLVGGGQGGASVAGVSWEWGGGGGGGVAGEIGWGVLYCRVPAVAYIPGNQSMTSL